MAEWEERENKIEKEQYIPQHVPHFPSCVSIDPSVFISPPHTHFESLQPLQPPFLSAREGAELPVLPPHPGATAEGKPGHSSSQYLPRWGQGQAEPGFPEALDCCCFVFFFFGGGFSLDPLCPASALLPSNLRDPVPIWQHLPESHL